MNAQQILVSNLQEALRQLQKYLAIGLAAALSLLLLAWAPSPSLAQGTAVSVSGLPIAVPGSLVEGLLIAIYMAMGRLCYSGVLDARKIAARINGTKVRSAAASFPTVISSEDKGIRILGAGLPALIYAVYLISDAFRADAPTFERYWFLFSPWDHALCRGHV